MGATHDNNSAQQQQFQQQLQQNQSQQNSLYQTQLQQEQASFQNYLQLANSTSGQNLSGVVKPNGGFYGATTLPQGTFLSSSGSRNTFLGG